MVDAGQQRLRERRRDRVPVAAAAGDLVGLGVVAGAATGPVTMTSMSGLCLRKPTSQSGVERTENSWPDFVTFVDTCTLFFPI